MRSPEVRNVAVDSKHNIRYVVCAYRKLSESELRMAIRVFLSTIRPHHLKRNATYEILSVIGARDPI